MSRKPEPNPDRERWVNDKKQKRMTKLHLQQKIDNAKRWLQQDIEWAKRSQQRVEESKAKLAELEAQLEQME